MNAKIAYTKEIRIELTAQEVAECFWQLNSDGQAAFFNELKAQAGTMLPFQMQHVTDSAMLADGGRAAMQTIGDYAIVGIAGSSKGVGGDNG